jgi:hypothetical protein
MSYYNLISLMPKTAAFTGLLDTYSGATVAYSLRRLRGGYTGALIRVRRSPDNAEQDISYNSSNVLDTTSLLSFVGAGNGFVTTWYDQSGNSSNAVQTTAENQPQIVSSGSVILQNTKPALQFDGTNDNMPNGVGSTLPVNISAFSVRSFSSYPSTFRTVFNYKTYGHAHNSNGVGINYGTALIFSNSTTAKSNNYPTTTGQALDFSYNQSNFERNAFAATLLTGDSYLPGISAIGSWSGTSQCFQGNIQEFIIYESNQFANLTGIKSNINTYYSIY